MNARHAIARSGQVARSGGVVAAAATTANTQLQGIQVLRFVAVLLVVHAHSVDTAIALTGGPGILGAGNLENFGAIGVDLFFVISGFIIARIGFIDRQPDAADFLWKRLRRIVPIYWLLTLPWIFVRLGEGSLSSDVAIATLLFWPAAGQAMSEPVLVVGWSLCFEMLFYLAAGLILLAGRSRAIVVVLAAYALAWLARVITGQPVFQFLGNPIILEFLLGVAIAWTTAGTRVLPSHRQVVLLCLGALGLLALEVVRGIGSMSELQHVLSGNLSLIRFLKWGLPAGCLVFAAIQLERLGVSARRRAWLAPWVFLGDASYSIYLVHLLVQLAVRQYGSLLHLDVSAELTVIVSALASCMAGALCYVLLERPLLRAIPNHLSWRPVTASARKANDG